MRLAGLFQRAYRHLAVQASFRSRLRLTTRGGLPFIVATSDSETFAVSADSASIHVVPVDGGQQFAVQVRERATGRVVSLFHVPASDGFNLLSANAMLNRALDAKAPRPWRTLFIVLASGMVLFTLAAMYSGLKRLPAGPSLPQVATPAAAPSPLAMAGYTQPTQTPSGTAMGASIPASALEALNR